MNTIILIATSIILKQKIKWIRVILAGSLGAIYSIISYISTLKIYSNLILKIILSILIIYIAYIKYEILSAPSALFPLNNRAPPA